MKAETEDATSSADSPPSAPARASDATGGRSHTISSATYPLPEPLVRRLKAGVLLLQPPAPGAAAEGDNDAPAPPPIMTRASVEDPHEALAQLVSNSIEAMDAMYFSTPARVRRHPSFQHRLCLRVHADPALGTLSVTDLGSGMTRADLINSLGISRAALLGTGASSAVAGPTARSNGSVRGTPASTSAAASTKSDTDSTEYEFEEEEEEEDDDDDAAMASSEELEPSLPPKHKPSSTAAAVSKPSSAESTVRPAPEAAAALLSCRTSDLGGFYAALCSLGTGVRVGTKARHDDYYEFQVGSVSESTRVDQAASTLEAFVVSRPLPEGSVLSANTGFDTFSDVRGESGTRVTIRLNSESTHLLDEDVLRPIFLNLLKTTQYTVAFSSDPGAQAVIAASALEAAAMETLRREPEDPLDAVADMDLTTQAGPPTAAASSRKALDGTPAVSALSPAYNSVRERAKYIPLRLSLGHPATS